MKFKYVTVVAELSIPEYCISDGDENNISQDVNGQFIKIKSVLYENLACGDVIKVLSVSNRSSDNTEEKIEGKN